MRLRSPWRCPEVCRRVQGVLRKINACRARSGITLCHSRKIRGVIVDREGIFQHEVIVSNHGGISSWEQSVSRY